MAKSHLSPVSISLVLLLSACSFGRDDKPKDLGPLPRVMSKQEAKEVARKNAAIAVAAAKHEALPSARAATVKRASEPAPAAAETKPVTVTRVNGLELKRVVFAKDVKDREPVGVGTSFSQADTSKVWVFLELANETAEAVKLDVSWEPAVPGAAGARRVQLDVPVAKRWRTQAFTSTDKKPGTYRCVVRTADGDVLLSRTVEITA